MHWTFRHSPRLVVAGLLACCALACGQADDTSPQPPAGQLNQRMAAQPGPGADAPTDRGDLDLLARAAAEGDARTLDASLEALYRVQGPVQLVTQGPIIDYSGHRQPVYIRHANSPDLQVMIAAGTEFKLAIRDSAGNLREVGYTYEEVDGGLAMVQISAGDLPYAGILLLGSRGADLEALGQDVFALAVIDDPLTCENAERECAPGDVTCMLKTHSSCITSNFDAIPALNEDAEPSRLITSYVERQSKFGALSIDAVDEESGSVTLSWAHEDAQPDKVLEVRPDGTQTPLAFERIDRRSIRLKASDEGFSPETLIALQGPGSSLQDVGIVIAPFFGWFVPDKTWTYSGCLQFQNQAEFTPTNSYVPLHNIDVRISTSIDGFFFVPWSPVRTNSKGCFSARRTFRGLFAGNKRYARVQYRLRDGNFLSWNIFSLDAFFRQSFSIIRQTGKLSHSSSGHALGTMTFAPGQPGALGNPEHRRRSVAFDAMRRIDNKASTQNSWLRFNGPVLFNYPFLFNGVGFAVPSPVNTLHQIFLSGDEWSFRDAIHEIAHAWHYKHRSGALPNLPSSLINGWDTHNCQEDDNVAFLEGFAEYFAHEALCGAIFNSGQCIPGSHPHPNTLAGLRNDPTCAAEGQPPLNSMHRVIRQDDGVTHGLKLLTADHFNLRDFQSTMTYAEPNFATYLDPACYWSTMDYDFWDLLWTFKADPGKGYPAHFSTSPGNNLLHFFHRFAAIHQTHPYFLEPRVHLLDPNSPNNPSDVCFERCAQPATMVNGQQINATPEPGYCKVTPAPANVTVQTSGRTWFTHQVPTCPVGNYDTANCHVLTPAPGVEPFIYLGQLYTTALPGGVCPDGWYDGANCLIAQPPPGMSAFIYEGMLYFTALYECPMGESIGSNICLIGASPAGTEAMVAPGNILGYIE
ncbi:hypothetical protein DL240_02570 [Lujinxingia litoralis]|uniref:Peptidase M60 domain-containing protein n=1 Tax=Lujinxingia litoralis TaxID=2211119 RepID=A0A328CBR9_9DELT|nr:hypothetical protein [Lujinxingia litoralis]RAL25116.1 hypothetical protein DL240_02570 [Lujinxingia litoralis]